MQLRRAVWAFVGVMGVTLAADQASKAWARTLPVGVPQPVVHGFWDWELAYNPGAAFSSLATLSHDMTQLALSLIAALAVIAISVVALRTRPDERARRLALAMIAGGALGNLIDRLRHGVVTDFVRWRIHDHRWPIFNMADAALLIGVILLIVPASGKGWFASRKSVAV